jgi:hypothetical protein
MGHCYIRHIHDFMQVPGIAIPDTHLGTMSRNRLGVHKRVITTAFLLSHFSMNLSHPPNDYIRNGQRSPDPFGSNLGRRSTVKC